MALFRGLPRVGVSGHRCPALLGLSWRMSFDPATDRPKPHDNPFKLIFHPNKSVLFPQPSVACSGQRNQKKTGVLLQKINFL
jgi:hypothetical protein